MYCGLRLDLNPEAASTKVLRTKTISVILTGANGNIGNTGPVWWLSSGVWVSHTSDSTPRPLDARKHRNNAMRCVCVGEEGDGEVMQPML
jgi:hypothetical protein